MKDIRQMQQEVDDYIQQFKVGYFSPLEQMARLTEEIGELAREISHVYGKKTRKENETIKTVEEELGDVLVVVFTMANSLNIDLGEVFEKNMAKFTTRDRYRFTRKDGVMSDDKLITEKGEE